VAQVIAVNHAGEVDLLRELVKKRVGTEGKEELLRDPEGKLGELVG
jgi:hypothetical protein